MRLKPVALSLLALSLVACGGKNSSSGTSGSTTSSDSNSTAVTTGDKQITIIPALGKVLNADIKVSTLDGKRSWSANTGSAGSANVTIPSDVKSILIEVTGGPAATYFEEADMTYAPFPAGVKLRAATLVTSVGESFAVTPLTNAAVAYAERLAGNNGSSLNDALVIEANDYMAAQFDLTDAYGNHLLTPPALSCAHQLNCTLQAIGSLQDFAGLSTLSVPDKIAARHAILLASLSKMARTSAGAAEPSPSLRLAQELGQDLTDGYLDGKLDSNTVPTTTYKATNVPNLLKLAANYYRTTYFFTPADPNITGSVDQINIVSQDVFDYLSGYLFTIFGVSNSSDPTIEAHNPGTSTSGSSPSGSGSTLPASNITGGALAAYAGTYTGVASDGKTACSVVLNPADGSITINQGGVLQSKNYLNGDANDNQYTLVDTQHGKTGMMIVARDGSDTAGTYILLWKSTAVGTASFTPSSAGAISNNLLGYTCTITAQP